MALITLQISGREVFQFRPELVENDDEEESFDMALYRTEEVRSALKKKFNYTLAF